MLSLLACAARPSTQGSPTSVVRAAAISDLEPSHDTEAVLQANPSPKAPYCPQSAQCRHFPVELSAPCALALHESTTWSGPDAQTRAACLGSHDPFKSYVDYRLSWTSSPEDYRAAGLQLIKRALFDDVIQALVLRDVALSYLTEDPLDANKGREMLGEACHMIVDLADFEIIGSHPCELLRWPLPTEKFVAARRIWGPTAGYCAGLPISCRGGQSR